MNQSDVINSVARNLEKIDVEESSPMDDFNYILDPGALSKAVQEMFPIRRTLSDSDDEGADPNIDLALFKQADSSMKSSKQTANVSLNIINKLLLF